MNAIKEKSLPETGGLASVLGEASLSSTPCRGVCTSTLGDDRCKSCGRFQKEITNWNLYSNMEKKLINVKNASEGYIIRQMESQENRWRELQKMKDIDNLSIRDAIKQVVSLAGTSERAVEHDKKCIDLLLSIIISDHKFNELSIKSLIDESTYEDIKSKYQ